MGRGRRAIPKKKRIELYEEYDHRCAYCGCLMAYEDMQVDHVESIYLHTDVKNDRTDEELNDEGNLLPACRQCNYYKSTMPIEKFRDQIRISLIDNLKKSFNFKLAVKYGMVIENYHDIEFYFEKKMKASGNALNEN